MHQQSGQWLPLIKGKRIPPLRRCIHFSSFHVGYIQRRPILIRSIDSTKLSTSVCTSIPYGVRERPVTFIFASVALHSRENAINLRNLVGIARNRRTEKQEGGGGRTLIVRVLDARSNPREIESKRKRNKRKEKKSFKAFQFRVGPIKRAESTDLSLFNGHPA